MKQDFPSYFNQSAFKQKFKKAKDRINSKDKNRDIDMLNMEYQNGGKIDETIQTVHLAKEPEDPSPTRPNAAL